MKRYIIRSVKYLLALCVLYVTIVYLSCKTSSYPISFTEYLSLLLSTTKGHILVAATILLSAFYPYFGYVKREVEASLNSDSEQIIRAFSSYGFCLVEQSDKHMVFRATGLDRLTMLFEDEISVTPKNGGVLISGLRRKAVKIAIRLEGYMYHKNLSNE
ncbi:MAG: hypothetical protein KBS95_01195 [Alistipes sp.]|nr:hypothetical protein [Candidatus Alistipes equi]